MSEIVVLDTHVWLWLINANFDRFPSSWLSQFEKADLSPIHKDPFDRLIIATALEHNAKLASMDGLFAQYPELKNCLLKSQT
jgi:PIN domain nuclease of toxin-antitoxin system